MNTSVIKLSNGVFYYNKFPKWIKMKYYEEIKGICSYCKKPMKFSEMEIHRITRKSHGGLYTLCRLNHLKQNCMFLHKTCHKMFHYNEIGHGSHNYA